MFSIPQEFSTAAKSQFDTQLEILNALTSKTIESVEKIIALNLHTGKAALETSSATTKQLLELKDPRELIAFGSSQAQPNIDSVLAYSRQLFGIASGVQAALIESAKVRLDAAAPAPAAAPLDAAPLETAVAAAVVKPAFKAEPAPAPQAAAKPALLVEKAAPQPVAPPEVKAVPLPAAAPLAAAKPVAVKPVVAPAPAAAAALKTAPVAAQAPVAAAKSVPAAKAAAPAAAKPVPAAAPGKRLNLPAKGGAKK